MGSRHKVAARNAGMYSRQGREGPGGFLFWPLADPSVEATIRSYARAREAGRITLADVPEGVRGRVRDA